MTARPQFTYFSPAALDKEVKKTDASCQSCGATPGELYSGPFYAVDEVEFLCLDCIHDGTAAKRFSGVFNDVAIAGEDLAYSKAEAETPLETRKQIAERTPGYESWQSNVWLFHCKDGAVFRGDASGTDVANASRESRDHFIEQFNVPWDEVMLGYAPGGQNGVYRFDCRRCGLVMFYWDCA